MAELVPVELSAAQLKAAVRLTVRAAVAPVVVELRALPRVREPDGSLWVDAQRLDVLIAKLQRLEGL